MADSSSKIGFFGLLAVVFITLKLTEYGPVADWSWWWVLSPLWLPITILIVLVVGFFVLIGIAGAVKAVFFS